MLLLGSNYPLRVKYINEGVKISAVAKDHLSLVYSWHIVSTKEGVLKNEFIKSYNEFLAVCIDSPYLLPYR